MCIRDRFEIEELLEHGNYGRWLPMWQRALNDKLLVIDFSALVTGTCSFNQTLGVLGLSHLDTGDLASNDNPARESRVPASLMRTGRAGGELLRTIGFNATQASIKEFVVRSRFLNKQSSDDPLLRLSASQRNDLGDRLQQMAQLAEGCVSQELLTSWNSNWNRRLNIQC